MSAGSEEAFRALVEPHLRELHVHCYRMMGSLTDADDVLQDTLTAAWRALGGFEGRASLRTWMYRIATNKCLNARRTSRRHHPPEPLPPFTPPEPTRRDDVTWLQPYPDNLIEELPDAADGPAGGYARREHMELAFIAALQHLSPRQTAVLVLRDVLGFTMAEITAILNTSPTAVKGLLQRARSQMARSAPLASLTVPANSTEQTVARAFADALVAGDSTRSWRCSPTTPGSPCHPHRISTSAQKRSGSSSPFARRGAPDASRDSFQLGRTATRRLVTTTRPREGRSATRPGLSSSRSGDAVSVRLPTFSPTTSTNVSGSATASNSEGASEFFSLHLSRGKVLRLNHGKPRDTGC